jgi:hypothetical protein
MSTRTFARAVATRGSSATAFVGQRRQRLVRPSERRERLAGDEREFDGVGAFGAAHGHQHSLVLSRDELGLGLVQRVVILAIVRAGRSSGTSGSTQL